MLKNYDLKDKISTSVDRDLLNTISKQISEIDKEISEILLSGKMPR